MVRLNRLPPEQVQHLESSHPTFADPEPGYTKSQVNRDSINEDQLLGDLIGLLGHPLIVLAHVFNQLGREGGKSTSQMSSPSGRRAACPNHRRRLWSRMGRRGRGFRRWCRVVIYHHHVMLLAGYPWLSLSPFFPIVHCLRQVFWTTSRILT